MHWALLEGGLLVGDGAHFHELDSFDECSVAVVGMGDLEPGFGQLRGRPGLLVNKLGDCISVFCTIHYNLCN